MLNVIGGVFILTMFIWAYIQIPAESEETIAARKDYGLVN